MPTLQMLAGVLGALAVIAGAFGAHGLKATLSPEALQWWQTGAMYHLIHALVLLVAASVPVARAKARQLACIFLLVGIGIFSGSLYVMALTDIRVLGAITPVGGVGFIGGWLLLAWSFRPQPR